MVRGPRWTVLSVLCVSLLLISLDNTILNVALPSIVRSLGASSSELQWIVDSYAVVFAGLLLVAGSLGDRFGRKWVFMAGLAVFAAGSAASAFSDSSGQLIAARAFMGVGAAAIMPSTLSILISVFSGPGERPRAIGIWSGTTGLGVAIGPVAGGWLLAHFWWGSVFLVNVPIALLGLVAAGLVVPNSRNRHSARPDPFGGLLSIGGMALLLWGIIEAPTRSWSSPVVLGGILAGLAVLTGFAAWERRCDHPMLELSLFRNRRFWVAMLAMALVIFALMGGLFMLTQYLQFSLGYSALGAGLRISPIAAVLIVAAPTSTLAVRRFGTKWVVFAGMALVSTGLLLLTRVTVGGTYLDALPAFILMGLGVGLAMAPCTDSVMGSVPPEQAGVGAGTNGASLQVGGAMGVAVLGSVLNQQYSHGLDARVLTYHVPGAVLRLINGSMGAALEVAAKVGGGLGRQLTEAARVAFVDGLTSAVLIGGLVVAVGAIGVLLLLPSREAPAADLDQRSRRTVSSSGGGAAPIFMRTSTTDTPHGPQITGFMSISSSSGRSAAKRPTRWSRSSRAATSAGSLPR
jgi:EmrB/QacA subfamily drug resistance transporter